MKFTDAPFFARQLIVISLILTLVLSIIGLFTAVRLCKKRRYVALSGGTFVLSFAAVFLTMRGSYRNRVGLSVFEPSRTVLNLPLWVHCAGTVLLAALAVSGLVSAVRWNRRHLSPVSIKESADTLPAGICFYEKSGLVRLINTEMNRLCVLATGRALLNGADFWQRISQGETEEGCTVLQAGEHPMIKYPDGRVVSFRSYVHDADGRTVFEIVAADVTEQYRLTRELEEKREELKAVNRRLVAYGGSVAALTREKELLAAKIRIHDDMGRLLLATRRRLSEPMTEADARELLDFWQVEFAALGSTKQREKKAPLQVLTDAANLVGVRIDFCGEAPKPGTADEKILIAAMHECLTNTVSHANGKTMTVTAQDKNGKYTITITNDGEKPKGEIKEGGGLSGLRSLVEREGGTMLIHSVPQFELMIELPQGETV